MTTYVGKGSITATYFVCGADGKPELITTPIGGMVDEATLDIALAQGRPE